MVRPGKSLQTCGQQHQGQGGRAWEDVLPDWKMVSQASVWACQTLVLRLLCSSTGVTIILPKVLIICEEHKRLLSRVLCLSKVTLTVESELSKHHTLGPTNARIQSTPAPTACFPIPVLPGVSTPAPQGPNKNNL